MVTLSRESVTNPVDGDYMLRCCRGYLDFLTQFSDVVVDGARDRIVLKAPHFIQELVARDDLIFMEDKKFQDFEFTRGQIYRSSVSDGTILSKVQFNIPKLVRFQYSHSV